MKMRTTCSPWRYDAAPVGALQLASICQTRHRYLEHRPGGWPWVTSGPAVSSFGTNCGNMRFMNQAALIEVLKRYDAALRANGATGLFIFGSRAVGMQRPDSDLDLFIDYDPEAKIPNMFRLMQIEDEISEALGVPVTITTRNALHPLMRESIERDAIRDS
jgi:uncharacterized protein